MLRSWCPCQSVVLCDPGVAARAVRGRGLMEWAGLVKWAGYCYHAQLPSYAPPILDSVPGLPAHGKRGIARDATH